MAAEAWPRARQAALLVRLLPRGTTPETAGAAAWAAVASRLPRSRAATAVLAQHRGSLLAAVQTLWPCAAAAAAKGGVRHPTGYWQDPSSCRAFLTAAKTALQVREEREWQQVTRRQIRELGGAGLLARHSSMSPAEVAARYLSFSLPPPTLSPRAPSLPLTEAEICEGMAEAREALGVTEPLQWRRVRKNRLLEVWPLASRPALADDRRSVLEIVTCVWPHLRTSLGPLRKWNGGTVGERRKFMASVALAAGVSTPGDWRRVTSAQLKALGCGPLLKEYGSARGLLQATLVVGKSEADGWDVAKCRPCEPAAFWTREENLRHFLTRLAQECDVRQDSDWERVGREDISAIHGGVSFLRATTLAGALAVVWPEKDWRGVETPARKASQRALRQVTERLLCLEEGELLEDWRSALGGSKLELDLFVPRLRLALEYQGPHHYEEMPFFAPFEVVKARDREKEELCAAEGIRLVPIPYWWDRSLPSLAASLHRAVPSLLPSLANDH